MNPDEAIAATALYKSFGSTDALRGVDLSVRAGTVYGLLGPNGAGKSTVVRILTTLTRPDSGRAVVGGVDVVRDPAAARRRIGLVGQHPAVDDKLTGAENLRMFGRLCHLGERAARTRADELLDEFGLADARDRLVKTYSGGMRRRLDLAASLIIAPAVLFLDEPTTGLDPRNRGEVWESIRALAAAGTTVLLTTQYLDEADQLASEIAVIDHGQVIASGTPSELKDRVGGDRIEILVHDAGALDPAADALAVATGATPRTSADDLLASAPTTEGAAALATAVRALDHGQVAVRDIALRRPTLDDVFLRLTGHASGDESDNHDIEKTGAVR